MLEQIDIKWKLSPEGLAELDEGGILTALKSGNITITASVEKNEDEVLSDSVDLKIVTRQERIGEALEEVKEGIVNNPDKYEYTTAMGLKLMGVDEDHITEKASKYSYFPNANTRAEDIMMAIAIGKDPKDYYDKNYVQEILDSNFYEDTNPEWLINAIIALDMAGADYDEQRAVNSLLSKFINSSGRYYIKNTSNDDPNNELNSLALIALSKHEDLEGVEEAVQGIKTI